MSMRISIDELRTGMLVAALEGSDGEVVLRFSKKIQIWTMNDVERFRRAGCATALVDMPKEGRAAVPAPPPCPARRKESPFPAMDPGSGALARPVVDGARGNALEEVVEELVDVVLPEQPRPVAGSASKARTAAPPEARTQEDAEKVSLPGKRKNEYSINPGDARSLNLTARYAPRRPLILSWKKGNAVGRERDHTSPVHPTDIKPSLDAGDDIIELSEVVTD